MTMTEKITAALDLQSVEVDLVALNVIVTALDHLDFDSRERALRYIVDRYGVGDGSSALDVPIGDQQ